MTGTRCGRTTSSSVCRQTCTRCPSSALACTKASPRPRWSHRWMTDRPSKWQASWSAASGRRQPPGFIFMVIEDEFGLVNIVVKPNVYESAPYAGARRAVRDRARRNPATRRRNEPDCAVLRPAHRRRAITGRAQLRDRARRAPLADRFEELQHDPVELVRALHVRDVRHAGHHLQSCARVSRRRAASSWRRFRVRPCRPRSPASAHLISPSRPAASGSRSRASPSPSRGRLWASISWTRARTSGSTGV